MITKSYYKSRGYPVPKMIEKSSVSGYKQSEIKGGFCECPYNYPRHCLHRHHLAWACGFDVLLTQVLRGPAPSQNCRRKGVAVREYPLHGLCLDFLNHRRDLS